MRLLLDTHSLIWACEDPSKLSTAALDAISDLASELYLSTASIWEMAIKIKTGRLTLSQNVDLAFFVNQAVAELNLIFLNIRCPHALIPERLPFHHTDPFDRMLISQ